MNILITGATGFLATHLIDALLLRGDKVIAYARNESKLANLSNTKNVITVCGDIRDYETLLYSCKEHKVDTIIHTAALKRIDTCQDHPLEAYKTNVNGTINCINVCKEIGSDLCFISTDKACEPCTTYGATKYLAEQLVRRESQHHNFCGYVIRYGNVLSSTGSVLGIWEKQFKEKGKVEVRDVNMTRFFWHVDDSVYYIINTLSKKLKGEVFIPTHIKSLNIYEMACYLYGKENIEITKSSHTEKIHESLSGTFCSKDHVIHPKELL